MDSINYVELGLYIDKANRVRRTELHTLKDALDRNAYQLDTNDKTLLIYPDDDLINAVETIIANGKSFSPTLFGIPLAPSWSFDGFLSELKDINADRLRGKLSAQAPTLYASKPDWAHLVKVLMINQERILRSPGYQHYERASYLALQRNAEQDRTNMTIDENCQLKQQVFDLKQQLAKANKEAERVNLVDQDRKQLKRMNAQLRQENAYLNRQMIQIGQETDREGVLSMIEESFSEKARYAQCRQFGVFQIKDRKSLERSGVVVQT